MIDDPLIERGQPICSSSSIEVSGLAFRFRIKNTDIQSWKNAEPTDEIQAAFVLRSRDSVFAYLNLCAHLPMQLDWIPGQFLTMDKSHIVCSSHGAEFTIEKGECVFGPCPAGSGLVSIPVIERDGWIYLK